MVLIFHYGRIHGDDFSGLMIWIGLSSVLRPRQHSIGYMGDGFYRSKDPTNSMKGSWLIIKIVLDLTRLTSPCYNHATCMCIYNQENAI